MNKWWQDPRLDDEGTYDYLVEELPKDSANWEWYYQKCESCGKYHKLNFTGTHYFYCWDGWDSISYTECWKCVLKSKIHGVKYKIQQKIKNYCKAIKMYRKFTQAIKQQDRIPTKEEKQLIWKICKKEI